MVSKKIVFNVYNLTIFLIKAMHNVFKLKKFARPPITSTNDITTVNHTQANIATKAKLVLPDYIGWSVAKILRRAKNVRNQQNIHVYIDKHFPKKKVFLAFGQYAFEMTLKKHATHK